MSTDFLIFYEHINREVENDSLIKFELNKRGYSCEIMPFDGPEYWFKYIFRKKAKVLVVPWLRTDTNISHYLYLAKRPYKLANLQWEQVSTKGLRECGMDTFSNNALHAYHLCWGKFSQQILIDKGGEKEKFPIVGAIQQDYGRDIFADYYLSKKEMAQIYSLNESHKWILYVSSYSFANVSQKYIHDLTEEYGDYFVDDHEQNITSQKITLDWIERYLSNHECEFIYRPHPTEVASSRLEEMTMNFKNFHVISDFSVKQWGKICEKVNIWISTSSAEFLAMNINYYIIRPIPIQYEHEMESMYDESFSTTYDEFEKVNSHELAEYDKNLLKKRKKAIMKFYEYNETIPAYKRVADALEDILTNGTSYEYKFDSKQKKRSQRIFVRTVFFSFFIWVCGISEKVIRIIPFKESWKKIIINKANMYAIGKKTEKKMLGYMKENGE